MRHQRWAQLQGGQTWAIGEWGVLGALLLASGMAIAQPSPAASASTEVPVRRVEMRGAAQDLPVNGVVEAVRQATVAAQVAGRILEVHAEAGQRVGKGQALMRIDARESGEATAAAKAAHAQARSQFERTEKLVAQKFISPSALDKARADLQMAEAQLLAAQAGLSHALIVAPISGVIAARHAEAGELASPGRNLLTIYEPGALRLSVQVPQARLPQLRAAKRLLVEFPELAQTIELTAFQVMPMVDVATHTAEVRIGLPASLAHVLPGMAARIRFQGAGAERLAIPAAALAQRGEMTAVYVETERAGRKSFRLRQLRLGERLAGGEVEVLAGLQPGENIALDPVRAGVLSMQSRDAR